ncbi:hypothetical protein AUP74_00536 [Microbulbifer aggregans]|uniref:Lipoprotein n=1 Tax=Microbulbifer aggregans TaxID=1769779 RepID=A0A1C9W4C2_9GAMM|nr:hypothetical protein AUP74_00536 [Microbulbifer aggregans]
MRLTPIILTLSLSGCATYNPAIDFTRHDLSEEEQEKTFSQDKSDCVTAALSVFEENPVYGVYAEPYSGHDGGYYSVRASKPDLNRPMQNAEAEALYDVKASRDKLYTQCMETRGWTQTSP